MSLLKCKLCGGDVHITGENSVFEPKIKCSKCGFTNNKEKKVRKKIVVEYK